MRGLLSFSLYGASFLAASGIIFGFLGRLHPAFDAFSHFRPHLGVVLIALALICLGARQGLYGALALMLGAGALFTTLPAGSVFGLGSVQAAGPSEPARPTYRLLQLNLFHSNETPEQVLSLIGRVRPDVVTLNEVSRMWEPKLDLLKAAYPFRVDCRERQMGVSILSRRPFAVGTEPRCYDRGSMALARVDFGGSSVDIAALHLGWPWPYDQAAQLDQLGDELGQIKAPAILAGDFNAAGWSFTARRVAAMSGMTPVSGIGPTWLTFKLPRQLRFAGLNIDHVLTKGDIRTEAATLLEPSGSDHWPVLFEFSLPLKSPAPSEPVSVELSTEATAG